MTELQVVTFRTGNETYGMDIGHIREIIMPQEITHVPGMAAAIKGIINLRGEIIPVVELAAILSLNTTAGEEAKKKHRVIILDQNKGGYGMIVDEVMEVVKIQEEDVNTRIGNEQIALNDRMVKGMIQCQGKLIIYLDPLEIMNSSPVLPEDSKEDEPAAVPI